jgi:hypothetical protein
VTGGQGADSVLGASGVPYFSQWESAELAERFVDGSLPLADNPRWAVSGARTPAEYQVAPDLAVDRIAEIAAPDTPVIASVHSSIRWPDRDPPARGGHLVLVTGAGRGLLRLHNPSGIPPANQRDALLPVRDFARFFARRGVIIYD